MQKPPHSPTAILTSLVSSPPIRPLSSSAGEISGEVEKIYRVLRQFHSRPPQLALALARSGVALPLSAAAVDGVLRRCGGAASLALPLLSLARRHPAFFPSPALHKSLLRLLSRSRQFPAAWALIDDIRRHHPDLLSPDLFVALIRRFAATKMHSKAVEVLDEMPRYGLAPDARVFACLLDALCKNGAVKTAASLHREMLDKFPPNLRYFTSLLYGFCKEGKLVEAKHVLVQIRDAGFEPDVVVYNTLLAGYSSAGKMEDSYRLLSEMRRIGCPPNVISYTTVIQALCAKDRMDEAMRVFVEMRREGCAADVVTFNTLISGFCNSGKVDRGREFLNAMIQQGCQPNSSTFLPFFSAHERKEELEECLNLAGEMWRSRCPPDIAVYNVVIRLACKVGELERARSLWEEMESSGLAPEIDTFVIIIQGFVHQGSLVEASGYFKEMVGRGLMSSPQYGTLKDLLNALLRGGKLGLAEELWGLLASKGCELNVYAWTIWIQALFANGHVKEACGQCLDMLEAGLMPQPDTFARLMKGLRKLYNRHIAAEITDKVRAMAAERGVTFKMYKRRGVRILQEKKAKGKKGKANKDERKGKVRKPRAEMRP